MVTASGDTRRSGDQEVDLERYFRLKNAKAFDVKTTGNTFCLRGKFHGADIDNSSWYIHGSMKMVSTSSLLKKPWLAARQESQRTETLE